MKLDIKAIKSVLTIYDELLQNGISLVYLGEFSQGITKMFTSMAEEDMDKNNEIMSTKRKVYHVMVETLQNMNKHSTDLEDEHNIGRGLFMIGKKDDSYYIITSNKVSQSKKKELEGLLDKINEANKDELKEMYFHQIKKGKLSDKGGAGLGLIDIARKTREKLDYYFLPYDEDSEYFILKTEINSKKLREEKTSKLGHY